MLKSDLHTHTKEDPKDVITYSAKQLIDKAAKYNFKVISITCHEYVYFNKELEDYAKSKDILLIPGAEIKIHKKEVLVYNITNEDIKNIKTFNDLRKLKKKKNILVIAPHPFFLKNQCLGSLLLKHIDIFDAVEYSNFYTQLINLNKKAVKISKEFKKPMIATSDSHWLFQFNNCYSLINSDNNINSVFDAVKKGKIALKIRPLPYHYFIFVILYETFKHLICTIKNHKFYKR